ncbi:IS21-like element helper ATPase IstB [Thermodesulfobium sp. 4217-1]|uniref:IS21-like element helper ATPase IstB n=1 Tax=Thermodesulfobium sp. 4217-1 TaxID=3120013 RepID=UPI00322177B4
MKDIINKLSKLKLQGIAKSIEARNAFAIESNLSYIDFLSLLIEDEFTNRQTNSYKKRFSSSKLDPNKTLLDYDFLYQPELNRKMILDLSSCNYIKEKKNIVFMGNPGVGKTHLANALGIEAIKLGYKVIMIHTSDLLNKLLIAKGDGTYYNTLKDLLDVHLLIIDEIGFKRIDTNAVDEFFEIIRRRYENGSIIITTNRPFEEWANVFGDAVLASAIADRIIHHCYVFKITGKSYRMKELIKK